MVDFRSALLHCSGLERKLAGALCSGEGGHPPHHGNASEDGQPCRGCLQRLTAACNAGLALQVPVVSADKVIEVHKFMLEDRYRA